MNLRGMWALYNKELLRFYKVAMQTVLAPVITSLLYLLIFSHALAQHVQVYPGIGYTTFLIPGLVMMSIIQNAFANSSSSIIQSKITGNLVFVLLAPLSALEFFLAFVLAAMTRAVAVGGGGLSGGAAVCGAAPGPRGADPSVHGAGQCRPGRPRHHRRSVGG